MQRAQRLKIRLRLAYYKVLTRQESLPLSRLPCPASPEPVSTATGPFRYTLAPYNAVTSTPFVYMRPTPGRFSQTTGMLNASTMKSGPHHLYGTVMDREYNLMTPIRQEHYPFHLGSDVAASPMQRRDALSARIGSASINKLSGTNKRPAPVNLAKSLLQLGTL